MYELLYLCFLLCHHFGIKEDREITIVRKNTIEFLGCFSILKHHCLLSAFKRSSVSNKKVWPFWAVSTTICSIPEKYAQLSLAWVLMNSHPWRFHHDTLCIGYHDDPMQMVQQEMAGKHIVWMSRGHLHTDRPWDFINKAKVQRKKLFRISKQWQKIIKANMGLVLWFLFFFSFLQFHLHLVWILQLFPQHSKIFIFSYLLQFYLFG